MTRRLSHTTFSTRSASKFSSKAKFPFIIQEFNFDPYISHQEEKPKELPTKYFVFEGADSDITYTVKVTLFLNGSTIATSQKTIKAVPKENIDPEEAGLGIKEYL